MKTQKPGNLLQRESEFLCFFTNRMRLTRSAGYWRNPPLVAGIGSNIRCW